ncbi:hypothetical protein [Shewanella sp.]|uniref:hypothetical protein n=1 Tax=Shewanella sp. TaxID=50422 RepID=UPI003A96ABD0
MADYAQVTLQQALKEIVAQLQQPQSDAVKAQLVAQKQQLSAALHLLAKCEQYGVTATANFTRLPAQLCTTPSSEYRIVEDCESDDPRHWQELKIDDKPFNCVRLAPDDVVIAR